MFHSSYLQRLAGYGNAIAFAEHKAEMTFTELLYRIERCIEKCKLEGINSKAVVALEASYTSQYFIYLFALLEIKASVFPYISGAAIKQQEIWNIFTHHIHQTNIEILPPHPEAVVDMTGTIILATSGTTGIPKFIAHDFSFLAEKYIRLKTPFKTVLVFGLDHVSGIETTLSILSPGGTVFLSEDRSPQAIAGIIQKSGCTLLSCTPTFLKLMRWAGVFNDTYLKTLAVINYGAEPMPQHTLEDLKTHLPSASFKQAFGTTETTNIRTYTDANGFWFRPGERGIDYKIIDSILYLKKGNGFKGYLELLNDEWQLITKNMLQIDGYDWYQTNDQVEENEDGYIKIIGRHEELINIGGEKIHPREIEEILRLHELVKDAYVYKMPHILTGEMMIAEVLTKTIVEDEAMFKKQMRDFCRAHLPEHKIPQKIKVVSQWNISDRLKHRPE
jgi:acyl-coenzyme A synthetase/AMP-(fatty) acid ligase